MKCENCGRVGNDVTWCDDCRQLPFTEARLRRVLQAVEIGWEHANEALIHHDISLGRTTRKNLLWAQRLEADIRLLAQSRDDLRKVLNPA